jgi:hypothetical protein
VPDPCRNGLVLLYPLPSDLADWPKLLFRRGQGGDWQPVECVVRPFRDPEMRLNPRRIHTDWLQMVGRRVARPAKPEPRATDRASPSAEAAQSAGTQPGAGVASVGPLTGRDAQGGGAEWDAVRLPVEAATDPSPLVQRLGAAIVAGETLQVRYHGGTRPGAVRPIRPTELFRVPHRQETYLRARDVEQDAERTYRLARMELLPEDLAAPG